MLRAQCGRVRHAKFGNGNFNTKTPKQSLSSTHTRHFFNQRNENAPQEEYRREIHSKKLAIFSPRSNPTRPPDPAITLMIPAPSSSPTHYLLLLLHHSLGDLTRKIFPVVLEKQLVHPRALPPFQPQRLAVESASQDGFGHCRSLRCAPTRFPARRHRHFCL